MTHWVDALAELSARGEPAVLVTVLRADGSTPREAGAKMVVSASAVHGTVGGGHLELQAIATARELLAASDGAAERPAPLSRDFGLGPSLGQCCGGAVTLLFEAVLPARWRVAVFGAGHVGRAVVKLLGELPCRVDWIDSREAEFPATVPANVRPIVADAPADEVPDLAPGCDVLVMTHSHQLDLQVVEAALRRGDLPFLGLIGSRTKRARFEARLSERGFGAEALARMVCPVGIPGVGGKHPAEIAIAVAAQLLALRRPGTPRPPAQ
jgi:xanthine dehydrogenase accessory factor